MTDECQQCGLPDLHDGDGDGIGSCDCTRCDDCDQPTLACRCATGGYDDPYTWDCCDVPDCACDALRPVETIAPVGGVL